MYFVVGNVGEFNDDEFTVKVHHGGFFVGHGSTNAYLDGKVNYFDHVEVESWSPLWFEDFNEQLHYPKNPNLHVYWLLPRKEMIDGLRLISTDLDTLVMSSIVDRCQTFVLYFDHHGSGFGKPNFTTVSCF